VFFTDANTGTIVGGGGTILRTTNGGATWTAQSSGTTQDLQNVFFTDANTGTVVGSGGTILRTTNGGENWIPQFSGTNHFLSSVFFTDANTGTAVGGFSNPWWFSEGTILRTTDGGVTWTAQSSGTTDILQGVFFADANTGTAVGFSTVLQTTDGGVTWTTQSSGTAGGLGMFFTDANTGTIVSGGGTILRTTNGGATWTAQSSGTTQDLQSVFFTDANTGTAVGGVYGEAPDSAILRTTDGGTTWTRQYVNSYECLACWYAPLFSVFFTDANTGTVVGELSTILRTTDGGQTWIPQQAPWNGTPSVNAGPDQTITLPGSANLVGTVSDDGLPNPPAVVTTTWSKVSGPGTVTFGNAAAVNTTASFSASGSYVLRLTANDSALQSSDDISVTVNSAGPSNRAPSVNAGPDQTIKLRGVANLDGTVSDDGLPNPPGAVTTTWSKVSGPGTATFGNANAVDTTASFSAAGSYVLRLTASDSALQASDDISIRVKK